MSFTGAGTCTLDANQAGNANYNAGPQVQQNVTVQGRPDHHLHLDGSRRSDGRRRHLHPDRHRHLGAARGDHRRLVELGRVLHQRRRRGQLHRRRHLHPRRQPGRQRELQPGHPGAADVTVAKGNQTITFTSTAPAGATVGGATYTASATGGASGNAVTFTSGSTTVCTSGGTNGSVFTFVGIGTCVVNANQAGNANYNAAPQAQQSFAVAKGSQTITFTSTTPVSATVGGATYTASATGGGSGNP